jgi:hypothetical protein
MKEALCRCELCASDFVRTMADILQKLTTSIDVNYETYHILIRICAVMTARITRACQRYGESRQFVIVVGQKSPSCSIPCSRSATRVGSSLGIRNVTTGPFGFGGDATHEQDMPMVKTQAWGLHLTFLFKPGTALISTQTWDDCLTCFEKNISCDGKLHGKPCSFIKPHTYFTQKHIDKSCDLCRSFGDSCDWKKSKANVGSVKSETKNALCS